MSKTMKIVKEHLVSWSIKPTNRNARKETAPFEET